MLLHPEVEIDIKITTFIHYYIRSGASGVADFITLFIYNTTNFLPACSTIPAACSHFLLASPTPSQDPHGHNLRSCLRQAEGRVGGSAERCLYFKGASALHATIPPLTGGVDKGGGGSYNARATIKWISIHAPVHLKPKGDKEFGHYLAGLIDGNGYISPFSITISFNILDASLAYYVKKIIGSGKVSIFKNKKAVLYSLRNKEGIEKVLFLINGKIRSENKLRQINILLSQPRYSLLNSQIGFKLNSSDNLVNHWLAGFSDAALAEGHQSLHADSVCPRGSFQIKVPQSRNDIIPMTGVHFAFQISGKESILFDKIAKFLGGFTRGLGRKTEDWHYYSSTSFGSAKKAISYFDKYHLLSSKYVNYLKWRKTYCKYMKKNVYNL
nr:hypothetical protein [Morchella crassipes]